MLHSKRNLRRVATITGGLVALTFIGSGVLSLFGSPNWLRPAAGLVEIASGVIVLGALAFWAQAAETDRWLTAVNSFADRQLTARYRRRVW